MPDPPVILYENGPCLAVLKPPGIATQAPPGIDSLEVRLKQFLAHREGKTDNIYLGVPHRLDRPVSGAMVFARNRRAATRLARQFEHRTIRKVYWACVEGIVSPECSRWRDSVAKIQNVPQAIIVPALMEAAPNTAPLIAADVQIAPREAILHYRTLGYTPQGSWLEIQLETGRYHQIRVQTASRGHPILGDSMYGATIPFGPVTDDPRQRAIALHARELSFRHPMTQELVTVVAPLASFWEAVLPGETDSGL